MGMDELREAIARELFERRGGWSGEDVDDAAMSDADAILAALRERGLLRDGPEIDPNECPKCHGELWICTEKCESWRPCYECAKRDKQKSAAALAAAREAAR